MPKIFPSLISGDLLNLETQIKLLEPFCDGFHLDVMDFHFVPQLTWGPPFVNAIRKATKLPLWVHLMVDNPATYLPLLHLSKGDTISIHLESQTLEKTKETVEKIQKRDLRASIAINPETPVNSLVPLLRGSSSPAQVLLMSVHPGASGQKMVPETQSRLKELVALRTESTIALDGGITQENIEELAKLGGQEFAVAHAIFGAKDPVTALKKLKIA